MRPNTIHYMSPAQFVDTFGPALQDYLEQSYGKAADSHVIDMLAHSGGFFDATYHAMSSFLGTIRYTEFTSSDDVPEEEVQ